MGVGGLELQGDVGRAGGLCWEQSRLRLGGEIDPKKKDYVVLCHISLWDPFVFLVVFLQKSTKMDWENIWEEKVCDGRWCWGKFLL